MIFYVAVNYRLKPEDINYIFTHSDVDLIIVDEEFVPLLDSFRREHPRIPILVDTDTDATEGELSGPFDAAILEGLQYDKNTGAKGWSGLQAQADDENSTIALAYTSGTTARPKGVEYTHRGSYMAAIGNIIESGLNLHQGRCRYLWTLPMFHAMGRLSKDHDKDALFLTKKSRLDIPVGGYRCERHTLLLKKDRLSLHLALAKT